MPPFALIKLHTDQDVTIVEFTSRSLDQASHLEELGKQLNELVDRRGHRNIILDFSSVQFLASSALGIIVSLQHKIEYQKGKLVLCSLRKELRQVFKFSQLDKLVQFHDTRDEALTAFTTHTDNLE